MSMFRSLLHRPVLRPAMAMGTARAAFSSSASQRMMARMHLIGRLAAEAETIPTSSGREMLRYTVVVNTGPADKRIASYYKVAVFPGQQDAFRDYLLSLDKGSLVHVEADARLLSYTDTAGNKQTGKLDLVHKSLIVLKRGQAQAEAEGGESEGAAAAGAA